MEDKIAEGSTEKTTEAAGSNPLLDLDEAEAFFIDTHSAKPPLSQNFAQNIGSCTLWEIKHHEFMYGVKWARNKILKI